MPPILIGAPVAFLPEPRPQTDFVADALPEPTGAALDVPAPAAHPASISARTTVTAEATPIVIFVDLMNPSVELRLTEHAADAAHASDQDLVKRTLLASTCLPRDQAPSLIAWSTRDPTNAFPDDAGVSPSGCKLCSPVGSRCVTCA